MKFRKNLILLSLSLIVLGVSVKISITATTQSQAWKFAVINDTQSNNMNEESRSCINNKILELIALDIANEKPDLVLVSGDLVNGWFRNGGMDYATQYANWMTAMNPVFSTGIKVFAVRGNHDSGPELIVLPPLPSHLEPLPGSLILLKKEYSNAIVKKYTPMNGPADEKGLTYSLNHKNAYIIALDQYTGRQHTINQKWLNRQLSVNRQPHIFIFAHEPAFGAGHKDNLSCYPEQRDQFWDSIGNGGARIYFCGHDHFYNRALIKDRNGNPVWQIINSSGGGRLREWSGIYSESGRVKHEYNNNNYYGYTLVTVNGKSVKIEWKALTDPSAGRWQILDSFTYSISTVKKH